MTNIELLRNAKVGDKFRKGNGDVLEIVEMPEFDDKGYPEPPYGKMLVNGGHRTWNVAFVFFKSVFDADDGLTPVPAEPVVDLKPARELKIIHAVLECGSHYYRVACAKNGGFLGQRHRGGVVTPLYAGPFYAEAVAACEADLEDFQ